jgi:hypothetical protein
MTPIRRGVLMAVGAAAALPSAAGAQRRANLRTQRATQTALADHEIAASARPLALRSRLHAMASIHP